MPRFPVKNEQISGNIASISGSDYRHITKVLRLKRGDSITLFDEDSTEYSGNIKQINQKDILVEIKESWQSKTESDLNIYLYQAVIKSSRMDLVVQKTTELGVTRIIPVVTERTQNWIKTKLDRLNKISLESAKQCRRTSPPEITKPVNFEKALEKAQDNGLKIILYENSALSLKDHFNKLDGNIKNISVFIGPEGGYTENEIKLAESLGYTALGLGKRVLRAETAAITLISLLQFQFGDLG